MSIPEFIVNSGDLFGDDSLTALAEESVISEGDRRSQYDQIREHLDRRRPNLSAEEISADEVGYFFLGRVLHILGYTHSHNEPLPDNGGKVDYTLFESPSDFLAHETGRGTNHLFAGAVGVCKVVGWHENLDGDGDEASPDAPAFELDDILRRTGLQWAMLTNGKKFRLYHRNTAGMLNTYYEVDLGEILERGDYGSFIYFSSIFSRDALVPGPSGSSAARQMLA